VNGADNVIVEAVKLTKVFKDFWHRSKVKALDGVDFKIKRGQIFGLLGPNGSGKSTSVKLMLGLLFPTKGRISVFGKPPRNVTIKKRIGYLPEESYLYRYLNADETLDFYGRLFKIPGRERKRRINALLEMVGLVGQRKRQLVEYSKGMARRIGLAQALINDPEFLVLDEPTNGLDPIGTMEFKELLLHLKERGKTIFLCSHLLADVEDVCDKIAILYGGRICAEGNVLDLLTQRHVTQFSTKELSPQTIEKIKTLIAQEEGEAEVEVEKPLDRLEKFFLSVVEKARKARMATPGAEVSSISPRDIFREAGPRDKTAAVLEELMGPKETAPEPGQVEAETPAPPQEEEVREDVLGELLTSAKEGEDAEKVEPKEGPLPQEAGEKVAHEAPEISEDSKKVIEKLVEPGTPSEEDDDNQQEKKE
jgi:ABC-2 type transport system ATP-binding protein